ncbi:MAG: chorismate mutase [Dehalococcoidia bacterium]|nr:chorismate mutase [Dehalococcoidia bacterium]
MAKVRGIRGATTADTNTRDDILAATIELLQELVRANQVSPDDVAAVIFTTTPDLNAEFPAQAARRMGWDDVPLLGASEISVPNGPTLCVRILMLVNTEKGQKDLSHVYLRGARNLRSRGTEGATGS